MLQRPVRGTCLHLLVAAAVAAAPGVARAQPATPDQPLDEPLQMAEPDHPLDGKDRGPRDRHWLRMLGEMSVLFGAMEAFYWANKAENEFDFEYNADWRNLRERFVTLEAWSLDDNYYETNAWRHPAQGALNYLFARSNGFSALESYAVSLVQSAVWEIIGEYKEEVSVNDIILTPRAGSVVGEASWQLGMFFLRSDRNWPYRIVGNVLSGGKGLMDWLDGKPPTRARRVNPLGLNAVAPHRFEASFAGARQVTGGEARGVFRVGIATELNLIPYFDRPGRARQLFAEPAFSEIRVEATRDTDALLDFEVFVRSGITTWHRKDLKADCGYNLLYGLSSAYEYGLHVSPGRETRATRDQIAIGHIGGGTVDLTVRRGGLQVRGVADVYGDYAMLRNYAIDAHRAAHPDERIRSTIERDNYHHALGVTARGRVVATYGSVRLGVAYQQDWFRSIQGLDRHQDEIVDDYPLTDRRGEGRAWLGYEHTLRPGLRLGVEAAFELRHREGAVRGTQRSDSEQRQLGAVQLVF